MNPHHQRPHGEGSSRPLNQTLSPQMPVTSWQVGRLVVSASVIHVTANGICSGEIVAPCVVRWVGRPCFADNTRSPKG